LYKVWYSHLLNHKAFIPFQELIDLEKAIEEDLVRYEELLASESPPSNIQTMREALLASLAEYESLAKEIQHLPVKGEVGGSQDRIQKSIAIRAGLFLQKKMLPLKVQLSIQVVVHPILTIHRSRQRRHHHIQICRPLPRMMWIPPIPMLTSLASYSPSWSRKLSSNLLLKKLGRVENLTMSRVLHRV
jgi:hypothetical protein